MFPASGTKIKFQDLFTIVGLGGQLEKIRVENFGIPLKFLKQIILQAEQEYPRECCGLLFGPAQHRHEYSRFWPCRNAQDEYHARDPQSFPRTSRTAYFINPKELLSLQKDARSRQEEIRIIYHSHIDAPPIFSEEDARVAVLEGEPAYPGVAYLILSVRAGKATEMKLYRWDGEGNHYALLEK